MLIVIYVLVLLINLAVIIYDTILIKSLMNTIDIMEKDSSQDYKLMLGYQRTIVRLTKELEKYENNNISDKKKIK